MWESIQWRIMAAFASASGAIDFLVAASRDDLDPLVFSALLSGGLVGLILTIVWWRRASYLASEFTIFH